MAIIKVKKRTETEIEVYVAPCIKCGRDEIKIGDCGYSSFNVSFAECKCGNKHTWSCGDSPDFSWIAKEWNKHNDIDTIIADKKDTIESLKAQITSLKEMQKKIKKNKAKIV